MHGQQTSMHLRDLARAAGVQCHTPETIFVRLRMLAGRVLVTPSLARHPTGSRPPVCYCTTET